MGRHPEADLAQTGVEHGHHLLARACIGGAAAEDRDHVFCLLRTPTSGHIAATPPKSAMNSRRCIRMPPLHPSRAATFGGLQRCGTSPVLQPQLEAGYPLRSGQQTYDKPAAGEK